jgi:hypothetical protein
MHKRGAVLAAGSLLLALGLVPFSASAGAAATMSCQATPEVTAAWNGGFDLEFVITNTGTEPFNEWTVGFDLPPGDTVWTTWNGQIRQIGNHVIASNYPSSGYNGSLAAGASTTSFGMVIGGNGGSGITNVTCTPGNFPTQ